MERDPDSPAGSLQPGSAKASGDCGCFYGLLSLKYYLVFGSWRAFSKFSSVSNKWCLSSLSAAIVISDLNWAHIKNNVEFVTHAEFKNHYLLLLLTHIPPLLPPQQ